MEITNKKTFFRIAVETVASSGFVRAISMVSGILVARELGASGKGVFNFGISIFAILNVLLSIGVGPATVYYVAKGKFNTKEVFFTVIILSLVTGIAVSGVSWLLLFYNLLGAIGEELTPVLVLPLMITAPAFALNSLGQRMMQGNNEYTLLNSINVFCAIFESIFLIIFLVCLGCGVLYGFVIVSARQLLQSLIQAVLIFRRHRCELMIHFGFLKAIFRYGIKAWPENIINRANARLDQLIIGIFIGSSELGNYSVAVAIADLTNITRTAVGNPILTKLASEKDKNRKLKLASKASRFLLAFVFLQAIVLGIIGWFAIPLVYGSQFDPAKLILLLYLPGAVILVPRSVIAKLFQAIDRVEINALTQLTAFLLSPFVFALLIPVWHVNGIAIGSSCIYSLTTIFSCLFLKRIFPVALLTDFLIPKPREIFRFIHSSLNRHPYG